MEKRVIVKAGISVAPGSVVHRQPRQELSSKGRTNYFVVAVRSRLPG